MTHIDWRTVQLQRPFDDFDRPVNASAKTARLG